MGGRASPQKQKGSLRCGPVAKTLSCFQIAGAPARPQRRLEVALSDLRIGQHFLSPILTLPSLILAAKGNEITSLLLERVRNFDVTQQLVKPFIVETE